jgi:hypothetical protein
MISKNFYRNCKKYKTVPIDVDVEGKNIQKINET